MTFMVCELYFNLKNKGSIQGRGGAAQSSPGACSIQVPTLRPSRPHSSRHSALPLRVSASLLRSPGPAATPARLGRSLPTSHPLPMGVQPRSPFFCQTPSPNTTTFQGGRNRVVKFGGVGKRVFPAPIFSVRANEALSGVWNGRAAGTATDRGPEP